MTFLFCLRTAYQLLFLSTLNLRSQGLPKCYPFCAVLPPTLLLVITPHPPPYLDVQIYLENVPVPARKVRKRNACVCTREHDGGGGGGRRTSRVGNGGGGDRYFARSGHRMCVHTRRRADDDATTIVASRVTGELVAGLINTERTRIRRE